MQVKLVAKSRKWWSPVERWIIKDAAAFAIERLNLSASPVPVRIILKAGLSCGSYGDSIDLDHEFVIRITKQADWLSTLFHEFEHIRQFLDDELELEHSHAIWKGKLIDRSKMDYWNSPWEKKARKVEKKLLRKYLKKSLTLDA